MILSAARVAARWEVRQAAREICGTRSFRARRASLPGLTPEVLEAFSSFWVPPQGKTAFGGVAGKLKQLAEAFKKFPRLWERFKQAIGVERLADIPKAIMALAKRGRETVKGLFGKLFDTWPLKIYTLDKSKLLNFSAFLNRLLKRHPEIGRWLDTKVRPKVDQFDVWLRERIPTVSKILLVAAYFFIWFNVVEFEWDLHSLTEALLGNLTLTDLLGSLPSAGIGALLNGLGVGTFTLLPVAFVIRLAWLLAHRYVTWTGHGFQLDTAQLSADLGIAIQDPEGA